MLKSNLFPPLGAPSADPILYGVAVGLAELFPPVYAHGEPAHDAESESDRDPDMDGTEHE